MATNGINVIKLGGKSVETESGRAQLAQRIAALRGAGWKLIVVHGGGAQVTAALANAGIEARFVNGLRVTDEKVLEVAEPVFGHIGKTIAHALTEAGAPAVALTGRDAHLLRGVVKDASLGRVGTITAVEADLLRHLVYNGVTPVVGPIATDASGPLNVNADEVASAIAKAVHAKDLLLLTDVPNVRNGQGKPIPTLTPAGAQELIRSGAATGGMIPKIQGALDALTSGVARVRVLDEPGLTKLAAGEEAGTVFAG
ncbi:MAG TPA: acetylglutamate kinase [Candidatus Thermoplasmatota archaeon]|nr:acetylglutamate kinase [Candidatus Thermoplasmatota archaeon]